MALDPLSQAYNDWLHAGSKGIDPFTAAVRAGNPRALPAGYNPATGSVGAAPATPAAPAQTAPSATPQPSATAGGAPRPAAPAANVGRWILAETGYHFSPEITQKLMRDPRAQNGTGTTYVNDVTGEISPNAPPPGQPAYAAGGNGQAVMVTDAAGKATPEWQQQLDVNKARNANPFGPGVGGIIGGLAAGSAFLPAAAGALGAGAAGAEALPGAVGSVPGGAVDVIGSDFAAGAATGAPGGLLPTTAEGLTAANTAASTLPAALPEAVAPASALPETAPTPPAASPEPVAPGPPTGTAPTAPTAPTPPGGPSFPTPTLGQAAQVASGAASAKTLLGSGANQPAELGSAQDFINQQGGSFNTVHQAPADTPLSDVAPGTDTNTDLFGNPISGAPGEPSSGFPGLPNNASDLLKLAPAIGGLAGLATSSSNANKYFDEIKALGGPQRDIANQLLAQYKAGTLNAADSFKIQQTKQAAINRANDFYAKAGIPDSTQLQGTLHDIDVQADAQTEQARQNLLKQGLDELNVTDNTQVEAIKAQIAGDQEAAKALTAFMQMLGSLGAKLPSTQSGVATTK